VGRFEGIAETQQRRRWSTPPVPLGQEEWAASMDSQGRITDRKAVEGCIYLGGVAAIWEAAHSLCVCVCVSASFYRLPTSNKAWCIRVGYMCGSAPRRGPCSYAQPANAHRRCVSTTPLSPSLSTPLTRARSHKECRNLGGVAPADCPSGNCCKPGSKELQNPPPFSGNCCITGLKEPQSAEVMPRGHQFSKAFITDSRTHADPDPLHLLPDQPACHCKVPIF
jgi:hypothetical protein